MKRIDWKELKRQIAGEKKYAVDLSLLIFLAMFLFMVEMSKHDMNDYDPKITDMTVIK